eukprot:scaffold808_cov196-Alexandrium_tamarense.AAC.28
MSTDAIAMSAGARVYCDRMLSKFGEATKHAQQDSLDVQRYPDFLNKVEFEGELPHGRGRSSHMVNGRGRRSCFHLHSTTLGRIDVPQQRPAR